MAFIFNLLRKIRELELAENPSAPLSMAGYEHRSRVCVVAAEGGSSAKMTHKFNPNLKVEDFT